MLTSTRRLDWKLLLCAFVSAGAIFLTSVLADQADLLGGECIAAMVGVILAIWAVLDGRRRLSILGTLVVFCGSLTVLFNIHDKVRPPLRWLLWSSHFKAEVLSQPDGAERGWKHKEWDSWGITGNYATAYIVYDPHNMLADAAAGRLPGVVLTPAPRPVASVQQLEKSWYSVVFYNQEDWEH